jgi:hypothetical protein
MRNAFAALLLAVSSVLSSGCLFSHGQFDPMGAGTSFDETQERFNRLVRWGHWQMAAELVADDQREHFIEAMSTLDDVKFTDWEIVVQDVAKGFATAHLEVRLEGYRKSNLVYYEGVLAQDWTCLQGVQSKWVVRPDVDALSVAFVGR